MLTVRDLMSGLPATISPQSSLCDALAAMNGAACRHLPVVEHGLLVGIITDRDLRLAVNSPVLPATEAQGRESTLNQLTVGSCMHCEPTTVSPEASAYEVADLLSLHGFDALPVVQNNALVGIITVTDYLKHVAKKAGDEGASDDG